MHRDTAQLKHKLEEERGVLLQELGELGRINPDIPDDWEPIAAPLNVGIAEEEDRASEIADFEERSAVEFRIEERYRDVLAALERIQNGNYGNCFVCGGEIENERLAANPAATTCKEHLHANSSR